MSKMIKIYPNPAKSHIYIETAGNINTGSTVTIANTLGKELKKIKVKDFYNDSIDISELPVGFYLLFFENTKLKPKMLSKIK